MSQGPQPNRRGLASLLAVLSMGRSLSLPFASLTESGFRFRRGQGGLGRRSRVVNRYNPNDPQYLDVHGMGYLRAA